MDSTGVVHSIGVLPASDHVTLQIEAGDGHDIDGSVRVGAEAHVSCPYARTVLLGILGAVWLSVPISVPGTRFEARFVRDEVFTWRAATLIPRR